MRETYSSSSNAALKELAKFYSFLYSNQFSEAHKMVGLSMSETDMVNFFNNSKKMGEFVRFSEATLINGGADIYISVQHEKGIVQWINGISLGPPAKVCGWDIRLQGNFRQPTERGQTIKETVPSDAQIALSRGQQPQFNSNWFSTQNVVVKRILRAQYEYHVPHSGIKKIFSFASHNNNQSYQFCLPPHRPYQRHVGLFVDPQPLTMNVRNVNGNSWLTLEYANPPSHIRYTLDIELDPMPLTDQQHCPVNNNSNLCHWDLGSDDPRQYLGITHFTSAKIDPTHPRVRQLLPSIIGSAMYEREKVLKISNWIANIPYEYPPAGYGWPTLDQYLANFKHVECGGHALLLCVFARAAGIPARRIYWPYMERKPDGKMKFGSHCIAEYFDSMTSTWFPIDATTGPFNQQNRDHWGKLPYRDGIEPIGLVTSVETMNGDELNLLKAESTNLTMLT